MQGTVQQQQNQNQQQQSPHSGSFGFTLTITAPNSPPVTKSYGKLNPQALQAILQKAVQEACLDMSVLTPTWNHEQQNGQQQQLQGSQQGSQGQQGTFESGLQAYAQRRIA